MARSAKPRKRKSLVRHADTPRYVVKLHDDEESDEDAAVLRFDDFDDAVSCCADLDIPFFVDAGNKKLIFWFVRTDDNGHTEIARCTEREFASLAAHIRAGALYCPDCGTVHYPEDLIHA
ncbi:transposase [Salmonella enterica subsp. enterica serovar Java]|nr:transposase [Salmonella enterica subsp. enterica serovar Java]ECB7405090.1 transposase [Salmonella enterica subsp. enterica serovar Java]